MDTDPKDFIAYGVLHFRDMSDEGCGYTCYYNYNPENITTTGTPLLLGFARCNEQTYNKKIGKKLAEERIQPHHIPLNMIRQIRSKKALLSYIKDYTIGFVIPRYDMCNRHHDHSYVAKGCHYYEGMNDGVAKGVWYDRF